MNSSIFFWKRAHLRIEYFLKDPFVVIQYWPLRMLYRKMPICMKISGDVYKCGSFMSAKFIYDKTH